MRSFEAVSQPEPSAYAGIPFEPWPDEGVYVTTTPPHGWLFAEEAGYWHGKVIQAQASYNAQLTQQGRLMRRMFVGLSEQRPERFTESLDEFTAATALVGLSRYLRTEDDPHFLGTNNPHSGVPKVMLSFNFNEAERGGMHIPRESLAYRGLPIPEDGQPLYFEGEEVFIQLTSPASFSDYEQSVAANHGLVLDQNQYASVIPRPKWHVWSGR